MHFLEAPETWIGLGLLIIIAALVWKRIPALITGKLDDRAAAISRELDEAKKLRDEAAVMLAEYKRKAANAEAEAQSIVDDARQQAERYAADARTALTAQIERQGKQAQAKIAQAEASAIAEIRALAADTAVAAAEKLITARLDGAQKDKLVGDSLNALSSKLN